MCRPALVYGPITGLPTIHFRCLQYAKAKREGWVGEGLLLYKHKRDFSYCFFVSAVIFIGGIVAATVDTITLDSNVPHNFGAVTRWIVMYPTPLHSHPRNIVVLRHWSIDHKCTPMFPDLPTPACDEEERSGNVAISQKLLSTEPIACPPGLVD